QRVAEILARTRSPAAIATAPTAGGGGGGDRGCSEDRPWTGGEGTGTFSDFAKSLRDLQQTGELDLSSEGAAGKSGRGSSESPRPNLRPPPPQRLPPQHHHHDDDESSWPLDLSGSLVIGEADMEVGGYARARQAEAEQGEELRKRREEDGRRGGGVGGKGESKPAAVPSADKAPEEDDEE
ncbi:unnamed protein product, partial [Ectocarpus sp. 12 AP-2014]